MWKRRRVEEGGENEEQEEEEEDEEDASLGDLDSESVTLQAEASQEEALRLDIALRQKQPPLPLQLAQQVWACALLGKEIGSRDSARPWFKDPRAGAVISQRYVWSARGSTFACGEGQHSGCATRVLRSSAR